MVKTIGLASALLCLLAAAPARAQEVDKATWIETMKTALPTAFCAEGTPFRTCFQVTQEECEDAAASAVRLCLKKLQSQIPAKLKQPKDGEKWGQKVGECAGNSYTAALATKKLKTKECQ
ncbi:MAG TPA: hypothetical protein VFR85_09790 [Anaeromyxobacteraceae bacterium]|nr:hypothetical protein [Anaeromyxobacteraceae bacterium]